MKYTAMNSQDVINKLDDRYDIVTGKSRSLLYELADLYVKLERQQEAHVQWLVNRRHPNNSGDWKVVNDLIDELAYKSAPQSLRDEISAIEQQLLERGDI